MSEASHPAPHRGRVSFFLLVFGMSAAPIFWLGQGIVGYWFTAQSCYSGDHPHQIIPSPSVFTVVLVFNVVAVIAALAGGGVSLWSWHEVKSEKAGGTSDAIAAGEGRTRFLAIWGIMSSLWFFLAILFNTFASLTVPPCLI